MKIILTIPKTHPALEKLSDVLKNSRINQMVKLAAEAILQEEDKNIFEMLKCAVGGCACQSFLSKFKIKLPEWSQNQMVIADIMASKEPVRMKRKITISVPFIHPATQNLVLLYASKCGADATCKCDRLKIRARFNSSMSTIVGYQKYRKARKALA